MTDDPHHVSRRAFAGMLAAVPFAANLPGSIAPAFAAGERSLRDATGVCVHLQDTGSAYHDWQKVRECLEYLRLTHLRTAAPQRNTLGWKLMGRAAEAGYRFTFTMRHNRGFTDEIADLETFVRQYPGSIAAIEGPNEIDHSPVTFNGRTDLKTDARTNPVAALGYQAALYQSVKSSPLLRSVPVLAFSDFVQGQQRADASNTHIYPRNRKRLSDHLPAMHQKLDPLKRPIYLTETGFHSLPEARPFPGTDEETQGVLVRDAVVAAAMSGVTRTFLYELLDGYPPNGSMETHFGLFRYDYSPKPAAKMLRRLLA